MPPKERVEVEIPHSRPWISVADRTLLDGTLVSGQLVAGRVRERFSEELINFHKANRVSLFGSGRDSLIVALESLDVKPGDEVIIPTYVCEEVLYAVNHVGASPRIADVSYSGVLGFETAQRVFSPKTKAIVGVHIFGHFCDIDSLKKFGVPVIEDACQAFGIRFRTEQRLAGTLGHVAVLSFHPTKMLTAGAGGALLVNDPDWVTVAEEPRSNVDGRTFTDINASLAVSQLNRFADFEKRRAHIQTEFDSVAQELSLPPGREDSSFLFRYTFRTNNQAEPVLEWFSRKKIAARRGVDQLLHRRLMLDDALFPNAVEIFQRNISIPFHPSLSDNEVERVKNALRSLNRDR